MICILSDNILYISLCLSPVTLLGLHGITRLHRESHINSLDDKSNCNL